VIGTFLAVPDLNLSGTCVARALSCDLKRAINPFGQPPLPSARYAQASTPIGSSFQDRGCIT